MPVPMLWECEPKPRVLQHSWSLVGGIRAVSVSSTAWHQICTDFLRNPFIWSEVILDSSHFLLFSYVCLGVERLDCYHFMCCPRLLVISKLETLFILDYFSKLLLFQHFLILKNNSQLTKFRLNRREASTLNSISFILFERTIDYTEDRYILPFRSNPTYPNSSHNCLAPKQS